MTTTNLERKLRHHKTWNFVLLGLVLITFAWALPAEKPAYAQDQNDAVRKLGQSFAKALEQQDKDSLQAITDPAFFKRLKSVLSNTKPDKLICLNNSLQVLEDSTACLYLRCQRDDLTFLVLLTCRKVQNRWIVCYAKLWL